MTTEIVQFKCPSCGHLLGEQESKHACERVDNLLKKGVEQKEKQLREEYELSKKQEVDTMVSKIVSDKLAEKDRQIEAANSDMEERLKRAVADIESTHRQSETESKIKFERIERDNKELRDKTKQLTDKIEEQKKTMENKSSESTGTAGERVLHDDLHNAFSDDELVPKKVGVEMADVIQTVVQNGEKIAPPIVWDRKTSDKVTPLDICKAKKYKTIHNTDYSIIVTEKGITRKDSNNTHFGEREGIYLVHPTAVVEIARIFRNIIIDKAKQTSSNKDRTSKQAKLYEHLKSSEYARTIETTRIASMKLDDLQRREEEYHKTTWKNRKNLIDELRTIGEKNQQDINDIIQDDQTSEHLGDEAGANNME
jgi:hypothetical protein